MTIEHGILFLACLFVASGVFLRRSGRRRSAATEQPSGGADAVMRLVNASEARLYDYAREIEAVYETRLPTLRALTDEADRAARRLEAALEAFAKQGDVAHLPFDELSHAAFLLKQAGYSEEQVTRLIERGGDEPLKRAA